MNDIIPFLIGVFLSCSVVLLCALPLIVTNAKGDNEIMPTEDIKG